MKTYYTKNHEWARAKDDTTVLVGISTFAAESLGDVVFVELPELNKHIAANGAIAVVESVKAASDIYAPLAGTVVAVNEALTERPELLNESPEDEGWIFAIKPDSPDSLKDLLEQDPQDAD